MEYTWAYVNFGFTDTISNCNIRRWYTLVWKQIYRHICQRENRDSIPVYFTGFSQGGQFVTRYMLIRQFDPDSIPIVMSASVDPSNYTLCTDTFNGIELDWTGYRCGLGGKFTISTCPDSTPYWNYLPVSSVICNSHVKQYYNENYAVIIGTNDTVDFSSFCPDQPGNDRYERAIAFYNFSDTNAINRGTSLKWQYAEIPDVGHWGTPLYNTCAEGDSIPIAERILFETPYHPVPDFSPNAVFIYEDSALTVQFTDISQYADSYWHWDFGDGDSSLIANPIHTYPQAGFYTVCLTAGDSCSTDTWCKEIAVTSSGIEDIQTDNTRFSVYPNPASNTAVFEFVPESSGKASLEIFNNMGQKVAVIYQEQVKIGEKYHIPWNINNLPPGTYFASLITKDNRKIIKLTII
ncbi:MAG: PKD domain-containing protein [Bacteroidota bacterium]|nr:PKD domain-containing protein [Bacteroidota bacterium]